MISEDILRVKQLLTVGQRIVEARKANDMTQLDLAKQVGISRAAVGQWEIDATTPSIAKLEEVANILRVEPQWLAYNIRGSEPRVVYRSPERDNITWVNELVLGDDPDNIETSERWGIPAEYLTRELRTSLEDTYLCTVNSHAVEPDYEYGDRVLIDRSDTRPSPAGIFLYWDGIGFAFARMQTIPGRSPVVRITQKSAESVDLPMADIKIIGRVKGRFQRG